MDPAQFLIEWYARHCDGEWEHEFGVQINTLDNPGWTCSINLKQTCMDGVPFDAVVVGEEDDNYDDEGRQIGPWWTCKVDAEGCFDIACGPRDLLAALAVFQNWVLSSGKWPR